MWKRGAANAGDALFAEESVRVVGDDMCGALFDRRTNVAR